MTFAYTVALAVSAVLLLGIVVTGIGVTSAEGRVLAGVGVIACTSAAYYLAFHQGDGIVIISPLIFVVPLFVSYLIYKGLRRRGADQAGGESADG